MESSRPISTLHIDLERIASVTVGAKIRAALDDLITAGRELEALSSRGQSQWAVERDRQRRANLADTVNTLQSLATDCWRVVLDLRPLEEGVTALNHSPTRIPNGSASPTDWPFPTAPEGADRR